MLGASWATYRTLVTRLGHEPEWSTVDELADRPGAPAPADPHDRHRRQPRPGRGAHGRPAGVRRPHLRARRHGARSHRRHRGRGGGGRRGRRHLRRGGGRGGGLGGRGGGRHRRGRGPEPGSSRATRRCSGSWATAGSTPCSSRSASAPWPRRSSPRSAPVRHVLVAVQASGAPCLVHSLEMGQVATLPGEPRTIMAGISCGTPSPVAWPLVSRGVDWVVTVD